MIRSKLVLGAVVAGLALAPASYALAEDGVTPDTLTVQAEELQQASEDGVGSGDGAYSEAPAADVAQADEAEPAPAGGQVVAEVPAGSNDDMGEDAALSEGEVSANEATSGFEGQPAVDGEVGQPVEEGLQAEAPLVALEAETSAVLQADEADEPEEANEAEPVTPQGWQTSADGVTYYYEADGSRAQGERYLEAADGSGVGWYYFDDASGAVTYGWKYVESGNKWVYYDPYTGRMWHGEGYVAKDNASTDDAIPGWCYFDDWTGATTYGWRYVPSNDGKWVYYDPYTGRMWHGEGYVSKDNATTDDPIPGWCYFDDVTGATQYGWKHLADGRYVYYHAQTGRMLHGRQTIDGKVYILNSTTGAADKYGYQNPAGYYRVSSSTVWIGHSGDPFSYVTPSRISVTASREDCINAFIQRAYEYLGTPYVWDYARQPGVGVDCVGLVMQCAYAAGMDLGDINPYNHYYTGPNGWHSHDANNLWNSGEAMHVSLSSRRRGDVISWAGHVAIYLGNDQIIEAYSPATGVRQTSMWYNGTPRGVIRLFQ